jgi:hypothetical protein
VIVHDRDIVGFYSPTFLHAIEYFVTLYEVDLDIHMKRFFIVVFLIINATVALPQSASYSETYKNLQQNLAKGWNTWNSESMFSHVLLPEAISVNICLNNRANGLSYLKESVRAADSRPEKITPGWHSSNGSYSELIAEWSNNTFKIQTASKGDQWVALITTMESSHMVPNVIIETGLLWNNTGNIKLAGNQIVAEARGKTIIIGTPNKQTTDYIPSNAPYLAIPLNGEIGVYAGTPMNMEEIKDFIETSRNTMEKEAMQYENLSEAYRAMSSVLGWNTIYDPQNKRVITTASRSWNINWGGWVLYNLDTYMASYMLSLFNKELAYANAVEITKSITKEGFVPNFVAPYGKTSIDRSNPPIGSFVVKEIYKHYGEVWFLKETYDELLKWNRWWPQNRNNNGYLSWGSNPVTDPEYPWQTNTWQASACESNLHNSPIFDNASYNKNTHIMELADVGLLSMYIWDCKNLSEIAEILGKKEDAKELRARAEDYGKMLKTLWNDEKGIYLNKHTDTETFSEVISPANFFPLLTEMPTQAQAERMINEHLFNPSEFFSEWIIPGISRNQKSFTDQNGFRGRIWPPFNFFVYVGLNNYNLPDARKDLVKKSYDLLIRNWLEKNTIDENYNAITGYADDDNNSDPFYQCGALLGFMSFIDDNYIPKPSTKFYIKRK